MRTTAKLSKGVKTMKIVHEIFAKMGLSIKRIDSARRLEKTEAELNDVFDFLLKSFGSYESNSQLRQDVFVLAATGWKREGFFVEFGAADGVHLSNTYLLEKSFGWRGILAEPARVWHGPLLDNRSSHIEHDCVWSESGKQLTFLSSEEAEYSTVIDFSESDHNSQKRKRSEEYSVNTISLLDLLDKYNAPTIIDYLSMDTEGSELEIIQKFDFNKYKFNCITVEHNYTKIRSDIYNLLTSNGYQRVFESISRWDDWYIWPENCQHLATE